MKLILNIVIIIFCSNISLYGQGSNLKARLLFEESEFAYNENNFEAAFEKAKKAEELLGKWTPKTGYMKIIALDHLCNYTDLNDKFTSLQLKEVELYIKYANSNENDVDIDKVKKVIKIEENISFLVNESKMKEYLEGLKSYDNKKYNEAFEWFKKGAAKGNSFSMDLIGYFYENGLVVEKNLDLATEWYKKAANKGCYSAMIRLVDILLNNDLGNKEAGIWMKKLIDKGNKSIYGAYGFNLFANNNIKEAIFWLKKCAELDGTLKSSCMNALGIIYNGFNSPEYKDITEAIKWYTLAADNGMVDAYFNLGDIYKNDIKDVIKAYNYYKIAAENGNVKANVELGKFYQTGTAVNKDEKKAIEYYLKAAELGDSEAMYYISVMYEYGFGVKRNKKLANEWKLRSETAQKNY